MSIHPIIKRGAIASLIFISIVSCQEKTGTNIAIINNERSVTSTTAPSLIDQGKKAYLSNCISCHNKDPNLKGSLGPEVTNVPIEVFKHKILTGRYPIPLPSGFSPRRNSKVMRPIPRVEKDIEAIHEWIKSMSAKK